MTLTASEAGADVIPITGKVALIISWRVAGDARAKNRTNSIPLLRHQLWWDFCLYDATAQQ